MKPLLVYIAAPYPIIEVARLLMGSLEFECCSRWLRDGFEDLTAENAQHDLDDVARCHVLVALNPAEWDSKGTGGRHVELGYALALGKPVVLVGERSNIFHQLPVVQQLPDGTDINEFIVRVWLEHQRYAGSVTGCGRNELPTLQPTRLDLGL